MNLRGFVKKLLAPAATANYKQFVDQHFRQPRALPLFTFTTIRAMLMDPTIRLGLAMRIAPLCAAEFAYKTGETWTEGLKAETPEVGEFVWKQLKRIWKNDLKKILRAQTWGWSAGEVLYRLNDNRQVEFDRILDRNAVDVRALTKHGDVKGVEFLRAGGARSSNVKLRFPKAFWHAFDAEAGNPYPLPILHGAYSSWADKWLDGGALDVRRLFMHKDAYGGTRIGYPGGTTNIESKGEVPNRDIARQIAEQAKAGSVITHPTGTDSNGKDMWTVTDARVPTNPLHILDYPKDLDTEMLRGLEIPDDVLTSESTGAWAGKVIPQRAFYTGLEGWLNEVIAVIVMQILEPLVLLNFGRAAGFEVNTKPLVQEGTETEVKQSPFVASGILAGERHSGQGQGGPGLGSPTAGIPGSARFSLQNGSTETAEALVGRGVVEASTLVRAARQYLDGQ